MNAILDDARLALRFLRRHRGFTCAAVAVLALGISLSAALLAIVTGMVSVSAISGVAVACAALQVLSGAFAGFGGSRIAPLAASTGVLAALAAAATAVPAWRACRRGATSRT